MEPNEFELGKVLLFDKPYRWTSFDVVRKVRNAIRVRKTGHAGTLDPLATGLLILCTGKFTKQIDTYQAQEKEYTGIIRLGSTTPSSDLETGINQTFDTSGITTDMIMNATRQFTGSIMQSPPLHSAVSIGGERAYEKARRGETMVVPPKNVVIHEFVITNISMPDVSFKVVCSKGTYIRSLASDFGKALGNGAHLASLCRTRIGEFRLEDAYSVEEFINDLKKPDLSREV